MSKFGNFLRKVARGAGSLIQSFTGGNTFIQPQQYAGGFMAGGNVGINASGSGSAGPGGAKTGDPWYKSIPVWGWVVGAIMLFLGFIALIFSLKRKR